MKYHTIIAAINFIFFGLARDSQAYHVIVTTQTIAQSTNRRMLKTVIISRQHLLVIL